MALTNAQTAWAAMVPMLESAILTGDEDTEATFMATLLVLAEIRGHAAMVRIKNPIRRFEAEAMMDRIEGSDIEALDAAASHIEDLATIDAADHR